MDFASATLADLGITVAEQCNPAPIVSHMLNKLERRFQQAMTNARQEEREACARLAENIRLGDVVDAEPESLVNHAARIAAAIRRRK